MNIVTPRTPLTLTLAAVGAVGAVLFGVRYAVQNRKLQLLVEKFEEIQRSTIKGSVEQPPQTVPTIGIPTPLLQPPDGYTPLGEFEFAYVVQRAEDGDYVHHVIGRGGGPGPLSEAMLLVMRRLVQQFSRAGFEHEVMLHVVVLEEPGSQHIDFLLKPPQQEALVRDIVV